MALANNPLKPTQALANVIGSKPISRPQAVKLVWAYIKKKGLQDKKNKRNINADENLEDLFGGKKQITMFQLTSLISKNLK